MLLCLVFVAAASLLHVNVVFAALLAGLVMARFPSRHLAAVKQHIADISIWFFVPIYFALVGLRLDLAHQFDGTLTRNRLPSRIWSVWTTHPESRTTMRATRATLFRRLKIQKT